MKKIIIFRLIITSLILISGCSNCGNNLCDEDESYLICLRDCKQTEEYIQVVAERFARYWEQKDFDSMYDMFIPELKEKKTKDEFIALMSYLEKESIVTVRLDKITMDSNELAYSYYTVSSSLFDIKAPAIRLEFINDEWKINSFASYFLMNLAEKKYFDTIVEISRKGSLLLNDILDNMKKHSMRVSYGYGKFSRAVCPDFKQNLEDTEEIIEQMDSLDVPAGLEELHNAIKIQFQYKQKAIEANYNECMAKSSSEKELYTHQIKEYWKMVEIKAQEVSKIINMLQGKYQTEKEKSQNSMEESPPTSTD